MVLFFDMTSMPIQDQIRAQTAAQKFLKTQMTPSDLMAIMTFSSDLKVLQDFTDDRDALAKMIKGLTIGEGSDLAVDGSTGADNEEDTGAALHGRRYRVQHLQHRPQAGGAGIGGAHARLALRKEGADLFRQRREQDRRGQRSAAARHHQFGDSQQRQLLADRCARPGGGGAAGRRDQGHRRAARACTPAVRRARQQSSQQGSQETLYTLAADTGGKALLDNNDLAMGIAQAQKEMSSYYILGYYSQNDKLDGRYRRIKLQPTHGPAGQDRQAGLPPGILRRQGIRQVQLLRQGAPACRKR